VRHSRPARRRSPACCADAYRVCASTSTCHMLATWCSGTPARWAWKDRVETAGIALCLRSVEGLAQVQEPRGAGCEARGGRGLGAVAMSDLKIEVARRQLGMATELYLRDLDPVSVHSLANAGCELIEFYARKLSGKALLSDFAQLAHNTDIAINDCSANIGLHSSTQRRRTSRRSRPKNAMTRIF
jgi:hypothetical protein